MTRQIPVSIFCFLISLGILFLGILPLSNQLRNLNLETEKKNLEIRYKENYFSDLREIAEKLEKHQESLTKIDSALPEVFSAPIFFNYLQKISSESGFVLKDMKFSESSFLEEKPAIEEHSFSLCLAGSYGGLKNFLSNLEKSARFIEVESISFSSPKEEEIFEFDIRINTHSYSKEKKEIGEGGAPAF